MGGVKFTEDAARRIGASVRYTEGVSKGGGGTRRLWEGGPGPDQWLQLAGNLEAYGQAEAYMVNWSKAADYGDGAYTAEDGVDDPTYTVRDCTGQHWGVEGEWILCRAIGSDNDIVLEVVQGGAIWHLATLEATLAAGGSAPATVSIDGQLASVTVWDAFLAAGDVLAPGSGGMTIGISYEDEDQKWYVTEAPC